MADFLQEIPKIEGHRFIKDKGPDGLSKEMAPRGTTALVSAWKVGGKLVVKGGNDVSNVLVVEQWFVQVNVGGDGRKTSRFTPRRQIDGR